MVLFASYTSEMQLEGKLLFMEGMLGSLYLLLLLPPFQNVGRFDFFRFIYFAMYLDICYIYVHSKHYESRKAKTTYILERMEYIIAMKSFHY